MRRIKLSPNHARTFSTFQDATSADINATMESAAEAFQIFKDAPISQVSSLLENIAIEIESLGTTLTQTAALESSLPEPRIQGETARTTGQLRQFAKLINEGSWVDARLDVGGGTGRDLRRMLKPLGPAVIFGASNFPLAFSVAGGDTAAALAARCPVVHKAHPAHPLTCQLVAKAIHRAVSTVGLPAGTFQMLHGESPSVGQALVQHPITKVGGFTGSLTAGRALYDIATARPIPIPFYAEMGSVNPVILLPGALQSKWESIATGLAGSVTMGSGQFCTNPGLVFATATANDPTMLSKFINQVARTVNNIPPSDMLTELIGVNYMQHLSEMEAIEGVTIATDKYPRGPGGGVVLHVKGSTFLDVKKNQILQEEIFGPSTLIVEFDTIQELNKGIEMLNGQLTASVWGSSNDLSTPESQVMLSMLTERVGRILFNGFPTGVEVCSSMVHGGPYPASSIDETSVGNEAIRRFVRPVCYQDCPDSLLPLELQDKNPIGIFRKVNDEFTRVEVNVNEFTKKQVV
tara:strand:- start:47 stop:1609 length:1563 start_codon:yes stop_codon:yes gene_type:complete